MRTLEYEDTLALVSLAYWYKGQYHSRATGDIDPTGELKQLTLKSKIREINAVLAKRGLEPTDLEEKA